MRGQRFTEEQIIAVLNESEAGASTPVLRRRHGVSEQTFYRWKARDGAWRSASCGASASSRTRTSG